MPQSGHGRRRSDLAAGQRGNEPNSLQAFKPVLQPCITMSEVTGARTEDAVTVRGSWYSQPSSVRTTGGGYMPTFCARWPDGSFSIVGADDETDALIQLDELDGCACSNRSTFWITYAITDWRSSQNTC